MHFGFASECTDIYLWDIDKAQYKVLVTNL